MLTLGYLRKQIILKGFSYTCSHKRSLILNNLFLLLFLQTLNHVHKINFMIHCVSVPTPTPKWGISYWLTACCAWIRLSSYRFLGMLSVTRNNDFGSALEAWDLDKIELRVNDTTPSLTSKHSGPPSRISLFDFLFFSSLSLCLSTGQWTWPSRAGVQEEA